MDSDRQNKEVRRILKAQHMHNDKLVLVTGGCGYIGSHVVNKLSQKGFPVVVVDDLSSGNAASLLADEKLVVGDFGDPLLLNDLFSTYQFDCVLHFAAAIRVDESLKKPLFYYDNNMVKFWRLLAKIAEHKVAKLVLSSTAAVYGYLEKELAVTEDDRCEPITPYGRSKLAAEWMLADLARVSDLSYVTLRYFNVAGAASNGKLGQRGSSHHLIKVACDAALGRRPSLGVYGNDYNTADGSCVRDYIHIEDLADAHLAALDYLHNDGKSVTLNCGYKRGYSVKEVIEAFTSILGRPLPHHIEERRAGDPPYLVADNSKLLRNLAWTPKRRELNDIITSALSWEKKLSPPHQEPKDLAQASSESPT